MANQDCPRGFRPYGIIYPPTKYLHSSGDSTAIYPGDAVKTSGGYVTSASATNRLRGVACNHCAASVAGDVYVWDNPHQEFVIQDDASATLTQAEVGENCDILATTGDTILLLSKQELNVTGHGTATAQIRIISVEPFIYPNGAVNAAGDNCNWIVRINEHELAAPEIVGT